MLHILVQQAMQKFSEDVKDTYFDIKVIQQSIDFRAEKKNN